MLRWILLAVLVVGLTAAATVAFQFLPGPAPTRGPAFPNTPKAELTGPPGKATVDGEMIHDFGTMGAHTKAEHSWVVRNEGPGDLKLKVGESTCSCTVANLDKTGEKTLKPGESTTVTLEWHTNKLTEGPYSQSSKVLVTNDPNLQMLDFAVSGNVAPAVVIYPPGETITLSHFPSEEGASSRIAVFSPAEEGMEITALSTSRPEFLEATYHPLSPEEAEDLKTKAGYRVDLLVKPGMPLGAVQEELLIRTDHPQRPEIRLTIVGRALGPISAVPNMVRLTTATGGKPAEAALKLWVRGQDATHFEVAEAPGKLKVEVVPADDTTGATDPAAKGRSYRMIVTVPPGTPPGLIGGEIVLKTDHPQAAEVRLPVNIKVLSAR